MLLYFQKRKLQFGLISHVLRIFFFLLPILYFYFIAMFLARGVPLWSSGSVLDHRSLPPMFESWHGHIWRLFHLWLGFITFGGHLAHLAYHVHKSGHKTSVMFLAWKSSAKNPWKLMGKCLYRITQIAYHMIQYVGSHNWLRAFDACLYRLVLFFYPQETLYINLSIRWTLVWDNLYSWPF